MYTLKQLAESATDLKRKYHNDIFFSARVKIFIYLFVCSISIAFSLYFFVTYFFYYLVTDVGLAAINNNTRTPVGVLITDLPLVFICISVVIIVCSSITAYLIIKATLLPISQAFNLQKRFVSGIAHELRTPLSVLRLNNELARTNLPSDSDLWELFNDNIADVDRINETLSSLLHYDRLVTAKNLQFEMISIQKIITLVTDRLAAVAKLKNITFALNYDPVKTVLGNQTALEQAFFNIIENAVTYSPRSGSIELSIINVDGNHIAVTIKDSGQGIPQKDVPHIFEPFYRSEKTGKLSGIGIGLAVAQQVIRLHQGKIDVKTDEGKGTSFTITLPVTTTPSPVTPI